MPPIRSTTERIPGEDQLHDSSFVLPILTRVSHQPDPSDPMRGRCPLEVGP